MSVTVEEIRIEEDSSEVSTAAANVAKLESAMADVASKQADVKQLQQVMKLLGDTTSHDSSEMADFAAQVVKAKIALEQAKGFAGAAGALVRSDAGMLASGAGGSLGRAAESEAVAEAAKETATATQDAARAEAQYASEIEKVRAAEEAQSSEMRYQANLLQAQKEQAANIERGQGGQMQEEGELGQLEEETQAGSQMSKRVEMAAIALAAAAAIAVAALAVNGAKLAISSTAFREDTEKSFAFITGSASSASALYEKTLNAAEEVGLSRDAAVSEMKSLLNAKFGEDAAIEAIKTAGNLAVVSGQEGANTLLDAFAKAKELGGFSEKMVKSLASVGVNKADFLKQMAADSGESIAVLEAQLKKGTLDADKAATAIEETINAKLGGAGAGAAGNISRLFSALEDQAVRLFDKVDVSPLTHALGFVLDAMKGPEGQAIKGGISDIFGGIFDALFGGFDKSNVKSTMASIGAALKEIGAEIKAAAPAMQAFISGIVSGGGGAVDVITSIAHAMGSITGSGDEQGLKVLGQSIGAIVVVLGALAAATAWPIIGLMKIQDFVTSAAASLRAAFSGLGGNLIAGIVEGIKAGAAAVAAAVVNAAKGALAAGEHALGINSPSTVFADRVGKNSMLGWALGVNNNAHLVHAAISAVGAGSVAAANDNGAHGVAPSVGARAGGGTTNVTIHHASPAVNLPAGTTPEQAHALTSAAHAGDQEKFDRMMLSYLASVRRAA